MPLPEPEPRLVRPHRGRGFEIVRCPKCGALLKITYPFPGQPVTMVITELRCPFCRYLIKTVSTGGYTITPVALPPAYGLRRPRKITEPPEVRLPPEEFGVIL